MPQRHALVIGISQYRHGPPLPNVIRDGNEIAQVLKEPDLSNNQWIVTYYPEHYDERTGYELSTSKEVFCQDLNQKIDEFLIQADGDALIYFGCHGLLIKSNSELSPAQGYIAASDSDISEGNPLNCISFRDLFGKFCIAIERYNLSNLVILMDCCHAGVMADGYFERECLEGDFVTPKNGGKIGILAACRPRERAYEKGGYGVFSKAVLDALMTPHPKTKKVSFNMLVESVVEDLKNSGQTAVSKASPGFDFELLHPRTELHRSGQKIDIFNNFPVNPRSKNNFINILGRLNYSQQKRKFQVFLDDANPRIGAFWLRGERDSAQKWLLSQLWVQNVPNSTKAIKKTLTMTTRQDTERILEKLARWLEVEATPEALIEGVLKNCKTGETVALVLYQVEYLDNGTLEELIDTFWNPLVNAAQKAYQDDSLDNPLLLFMVDLGKKGDRPCPLNHSSDYDPEHPEQFVELVTQRFQARDFRWLTDNETELYPFLKNGSLEAIKKDMIDYNQKPNTKPEEVFTELCDHFGLDWYSDIARQFLAG
jgi:hypothetical protein